MPKLSKINALVGEFEPSLIKLSLFYLDYTQFEYNCFLKFRLQNKELKTNAIFI